MSEAPRDPMRAAQANMRPAAIKRFYKTVEVREAADGQYALMLDGRGARTPGRNPLAAKSRALMLEVAAEWERQRDTLDPGRHAADPATQLGGRRRLAHDGRDARGSARNMPAPISSATALRSRKRWPNASGSLSIRS